jgi:outer membrane protein OmpA-like peptidoglycan-associated protein
MERIFVTSLVLTGALLAGGCATKKYVRETTAPIQAKVDQVGEQTTKNGQTIQQNKTEIEGQVKQVDEKAQSGISAAKEQAMTANNHAQEAMTKATQVGQQVDQTNQQLATLRQSVANLDEYKMATEITVPFRFDRYALTDDDKTQLDTLAASASKLKRYFITVEGFTDKTGSIQYNETLSRRRADAVAQYLVAKHDIPLYRIHMIGLGEQKPVEEAAKTRAARAKNRRVEVRLFSADQGATVSQLQK